MMYKKIFSLIILLLALSLIVVACSSNDGNVDIKTIEENNDLKAKNKILQQEKEELKNEIENLEATNSTNLSSPINLIDFSLDVMNIIENNDMDALSTYVHPTKGVRFTPYTYVDIQNDKVFTSGEFVGLSTDNTVYTWGDYDGIGDPIDLTFTDYYNEFVYDHEFLNPHMIGNNETIGTGNMIDNTLISYPNGSFIEYHFTGFDPQYEGIDWASLTLVFEQDNGDWYLVGIIHGQWTI